MTNSLIANWIFAALVVWFLYGLVTPIIRHALDNFKAGRAEEGTMTILGMLALLLVIGISFVIFVS